jgi:hypothetical protein
MSQPQPTTDFFKPGFIPNAEDRNNPFTHHFSFEPVAGDDDYF